MLAVTFWKVVGAVSGLAFIFGGFLLLLIRARRTHNSGMGGGDFDEIIGG